MEAKIKLIRHAVPDPKIPAAKRYAWPLVVTAEGTNIPSEIFVYHIGASGEAVPGDKFECIASISQLYEIPIGHGVSLTTEHGIPYYRASTLELVCRSPEELESVWSQIQEEVHWLIRNFDQARTVVGIDYAEITGEAITQGDFGMTPPIRIQLSYHPAGIATVSNNIQDIESPDPTKMGWLPANYAPSQWIKPGGAFLYYNKSADSALNAVWPPKEPFSGNAITWSGMVLPYGVVYVITKDAIWWLTYDADVLMRYIPVSGQGLLNAPWPSDYVNENNLGVVSPIIALTLFK